VVRQSAVELHGVYGRSGDERGAGRAACRALSQARTRHDLRVKAPAGAKSRWAFVTLIGPRDSGKSAILSAIDMALGNRWILSLGDSDFHRCDVEEPISIRVALTDLPPGAVRRRSPRSMRPAR
jgi:hypothetical protein